MGRLRGTGSLGRSCGDNWDSTKARSRRARPRPLGAQKGPGRGRAEDSRGRPSPMACTPASRPGTPHFRGEQGGAGRPAPPPATLSGPSPGFGGSSGARGPRLREEAFAKIPGGGGGPGSGGRDGWRRRLGRRRRCRALPLSLSRPGPRPATARSARPASSACPAPLPALTLQRPALPAADATYPGKARAGPGSEPTDKK